MTKRIPPQREQISEQIRSQNRKIGRVVTTSSRVFGLGSENVIAPNNDDNITFAWRKRMYSNNYGIPIRTPDRGDFVAWAIGGGSFQTSIIGSTTGRLIDRNIPRHANIVYSIEVFRKTATTINGISLRCSRSVRIEVNGQVVHDSGDSVYNTKTKINISIPAQRWTRIDIYFYSSDPNTDNNYIEFLADFYRYVEKTRSSVPRPPTDLVASQGDFQNEIKLTWSAPDDVYYDKFQVWYGNDITTQDVLLTTAIPGDSREYVHGGIPEATTYWYKVRGLTYDGDITDFSAPAEGWSGQGSTANSLRIETEPNQFATNFPISSRIPEVSALTSGYFTNETIYIDVISEFEVQNAPTVSISGADGAEFNNYSPLIINATDEGQVDAFTWRYSFDPSVFLNGRIWILADANAGALTAKKFIVYDTNPPTFDFTIESDDIPTDGGDPYTRSQYVNILTNSVNDVLPVGSRYDDPIDGYRYSAGPLFLALSNNQIGYGYYEYSDGVIYSWDLARNVTLTVGERTVYGTLYDRAGNANTDVSDTIYYATGTIADVTNFSTTEYYDKIHLEWDPISESDLYGYKIWRNDTGVEPSDGDPPTINIPDIQITGYNDLADFNGGDLERGTTYYYWIKGYTLFGRESATFVAAGATALRTDKPNLDVGVSLSRVGNQLQYVFKNSSAQDADPDRRATRHHIYRYDVGTYGYPTNANNFKFLQTITETGNSSHTFTGVDTPPLAGNEYNYWSRGENAYGIQASGYGCLNSGAGLSLNAGPPNAPTWADGQMYQTHHIIRLAWEGGAESDLQVYRIFRDSGTYPGDPGGTPEIVAAIPYNDANNEMQGDIFTWDDIRSDGNEGSIQTGEDYTYWIKAYDTAGEGSAYSDPRTFALSTSAPPVPQWVSGECYAWFGYNHLTITGGEDSSNLVRGYHIYRALVTGASNYNHSGSAVHIGTIPDSRAFGITNSYDDHDVDFGSEYQYWCTSFNDYESNWSAALTGLGVVKPNYDTLFINLLDNSSFEKAFNSSFNWNGNDGQLRTNVAAPFGHYAFEVGGNLSTLAAYSGYIMVEPSENYMVSLYGKHGTNLGQDLRIEVNWYGPGKEFLSTDTTDIDNGDFSSSWQRLTGNSLFTAPASASSATMRLYTLVSNQTYNIDALQFERYVAGESPRPYVDSTIITADILGGHIIRGDMIVASSIRAIHISGESITANEIQAGSITLDRLETIPGAQVTYRVTGADYSDLVRKDPTAYLIDSGTHTIFVPTGTLRFDTVEYTIDGVRAGTGITSAVGGLATAADNNSAYYGFYDEDFPTKIVFTSNMSDAFESGNFLVWKFTNKANSAPGINAGYFVFDGPFSGPPVVLDGSAINAGEIHGQFITASSIEANRIVVGTIGNMIENSAFGIYNWGYVLTGDDIPLMLRDEAIANWSLYRGAWHTIADTLFQDQVGWAKGPLFDTTDGAPKFRGIYQSDPANILDTGEAISFYIMPYADAGTGARTSNYWIISDRIPISTDANYRMSSYFMIGDTVDAFAGGTWTFLGLKAYNSSGEEIVDPGAVGPNWLTPTEHGDSQTDPMFCYYRDKIIANDYSGQTSEWIRTGYDLQITGADVHSISVLIGTTVDNHLDEPQVPYYYFDGIMFENASGTDSPWSERNTTMINGGHITARSITASLIAVEAINASHISAGAITAGAVAADTISGANIIAGTLTSISANLVRDGQFERWTNTTGWNFTGVGSNQVADKNPLSDWYGRLSPNGGNLTAGWYRDTGHKLFGRASLMLSGTSFGNSNTRLEQGVSSQEYYGSQNWGIALEPSTQYTYGVWVYKHPGAFSYNTGIYVAEYNVAGSLITTNNITTNSVSDSTWTFLSETFTTNASTTRAIVSIREASNYSSSTPYMFSYDGARLVKGNECPSGYMSDGQTTIDAGYIRTGTIDAELVTISGATSQVVINASGITVGLAGGDQTLISNRDVKYVKDGTAYQYAKRVEIYERVPIGSAFSFPVSFIDIPKIMIAPSLEVRTFDAGVFALDNNQDQYLTLRPESITADGFTPKGYITTGDSSSVTKTYGGDAGWTNSDDDIGTQTIKWSSGTVSSFESNYISYGNGTNASHTEADSITLYVGLDINTLTADTSHPRYGDVWYEIQLLVGLTEDSSTALTSVQSVTASGHIGLDQWGGGFGTFVVPLTIDGLSTPTNPQRYGFQLRFYELGGGSNAITDANISYFGLIADYEAFDPTLGVEITKGYVRVLAIEDNQSA